MKETHDSIAIGSFHSELQDALSKLILSASGWRGVFAASGNGEDRTAEIPATHTVFAALMARVYADFIIKHTGKVNPTIALGMDARPTGPAIASAMFTEFSTRGIEIEFLGVTAAPEIMAYSKAKDGFVYISASHNPIGHNGVKFGLNDGGVIPGSTAKALADEFRRLCAEKEIIGTAFSSCAQNCTPPSKSGFSSSFAAPSPESSEQHKAAALDAYRAFARAVISDEDDPAKQDSIFNTIKAAVAVRPLAVACDCNGSARTKSIDRAFFKECGIGFHAMNDTCGGIVHAIIPEPENLVHVAALMEELHAHGKTDVLLGYMPDCDGDRGNIVFWNERTQKPELLKAQEVFALSVMAELAFMAYQGKTPQNGYKLAVSVNDPTSMRIDEIATAFGAEVYRAEVGEANVVNLARELRTQGFAVRILGEGSNGGNITHPAAVRDPLNSLFALIKLLVLRDEYGCDGGITKKGLFHLWCALSGQEAAYKDGFTLADVMDTLPRYTTTGVSESRALLHIKSASHAELKGRYQKIFEAAWNEKKAEFAANYGIASYEAVANNGTKETRNLTDYRVSDRGGLKIIFKGADGKPVAFIWMRGSGTEPVFRVMCDVKGDNAHMERDLLAWHTALILKADLDTAS